MYIYKIYTYTFTMKRRFRIYRFFITLKTFQCNKSIRVTHVHKQQKIKVGATGRYGTSSIHLHTYIRVRSVVVCANLARGFQRTCHIFQSTLVFFCHRRTTKKVQKRQKKPKKNKRARKRKTTLFRLPARE